MTRPSLVLLLALTAVGCVSWQRGNGQLPNPATPPPRPGMTANSGSGVPEISQKPVDGKSAPATLIAKDGTRCTVSESKFRETSIGEKVSCAWQ